MGSLQIALAGPSYEIECTFSYLLHPGGPLVASRDGNLYGTSIEGPERLDGGLIFKVSPGGKRTNVHQFSGMRSSPRPNRGGAFPIGRLVAGEDGSIYGATRTGGVYGEGNIFHIAPDGKFTVLHDFRTPPGQSPGYDVRSLLMTPDGDFYGYREGGTGDLGVLFCLTNEGDFSNVINFGTSDAPTVKRPIDLLLGSDGNMYGTSQSGGVQINYPGYSVDSGTVFRINWDGGVTVLMTGDATHRTPYSLDEAPDGSFFGIFGEPLTSVIHLSSNGEPSYATVPGIGFGTPANDGAFYTINGERSLFKIDTQGVATNLGNLGSNLFPLKYFKMTQGWDGRIWGWDQKKNTHRIFSVTVPGLEPANIPPMAREDEIALKDLRSKSKNAPGTFEAEIKVLKNDKDANDDPLSILSFTNPEHGTVTLNAEKTEFRYTTENPTTDSFSYTISDGMGGSATARVRILPKVNPSYSGVLSAEGSGLTLPLKVAITPRGKVAGKVEFDGETYSFHGWLNKFGKLTTRAEKGDKTLFLNLKATPDDEDWKVTATANEIGNFEVTYAGDCEPKKLNSRID